MLKKMCKKRGFTLMETLGVIAIIVILCAIAIPTVISVRATMAQKQLDSYAKTIYLAAQRTLVEMRRDGELEQLQVGLNTAKIDGNTEGKYVYVSSGGTCFDTVLPANSVEATLTANQIIIEFNPKTGAMYSVFYSEGENIDFYNDATTVSKIRNEETRKEYKVGYYNGGSTINGSAGAVMEEQWIADISAQLSFDKGEEGILQIWVPMQVLKDSQPINISTNPDEFFGKLNVDLTIYDDKGNTINKTVTMEDAKDNVKYEAKANADSGGANVLHIYYPLDSLLTGKGFGAIPENKEPKKDASGNEIKDKDGNVLTVNRIAPGDNITVMAEVTYEAQPSDPIVDIDNAIIAGINPMFDSLIKSEESGKYTLAVANGRHLQNLNLLSADIAENVEAVVFVADDVERAAADAAKLAAETDEEKAKIQPKIIIDWNDTLTHYGNSEDIKFKPIVNEALFGSVEQENNTEEETQGNEAVCASVIGNGCKIYNLTINHNGEKTPYVGMLAYVNSSVSGIELVNPKIVGGDNTLATGALAGVIGSKAQLTDCGVYLDTEVEGFELKSTTESGEEICNYFVKGHGAVGGLVGYACSDKDVSDVDLSLTPEELKKEGIELKDYVSLYRCFAAVPVDGTMPKEEKVNGKWNGVGGLVGNTQQANFYSCYASGDVNATGVANASPLTEDEIKNNTIHYEDGAITQGVGGFVGTSHGSCYSNCFATSNVIGDGNAAGGFVGVMCYDSAVDSQHTVFSNCYAVGGVTVKANATEEVKLENFSGVLAKIKGVPTVFDYNELVEGEKLPEYQALYLYKNSYYLDQSIGSDPVTEHCAVAKRYSTFKELTGYGFSENVWGTTTDKETHTYEDEAYNPTYPFSMLKNMEYYGNWPTETPGGGLAYYEVYRNEEEYEIGFYYDKKETATLKDILEEKIAKEDKMKDSEGEKQPQDIIVISDGYAIFLNNKPSNDVTVNCNGKDYALSVKDQPVQIGEDEYYYAFLPKDLMSVDESEFYKTVTMSVSIMETNKETGVQNKSEKDYTLYFNPNVALSQVNPTDGGTGSAKAPTTPDKVYIRSARQLAAVGKYMSKFWTNELLKENLVKEYVQQLDIDFSKYDACTYTEGLTNEKDITEIKEWAIETTPIGYGIPGENGSKPFTARYTVPSIVENKAVRLLTKKIIGYSYDDVDGAVNSGIFGVIGRDGFVSGLEIVPVVENAAVDKNGQETGEIISKLDIKTSNAKTLGLLAGVNYGTISNSTVTLTGDVEVKNQQEGNILRSVGLLVGESMGTLNSCSVVVPTHLIVDKSNVEKYVYYNVDVSIESTNVGTVAGCLVGGVMKDCSVSYEGRSSLNLTVDGKTVGGLVGCASEYEPFSKEPRKSTLSGCTVLLDLQVKNPKQEQRRVGGLIGDSINTQVEKCTAMGGTIKKHIEESVQLVNNTSVEETAVGGAIGYAYGGTYDNVTTNAIIADNWRGSPAVEVMEKEGETTDIILSSRKDLIDEAGNQIKESIGQFVGHVDSGNFVECNSVDDTNTQYHFLGTIKAKLGQKFVGGTHYRTEKFTAEELKKPILLSELTKVDVNDENTTGDQVQTYEFPNTVLENCKFYLVEVDGVAKEYLQTLDRVYYYNLTDYSVQETPAVFDPVKLSEAGVFELTDDDKEQWNKSLGDNSETWVATNYYALVTDEEETVSLYKRVYVKVTKTEVENKEPEYAYEFGLREEADTGSREENYDDIPEKAELYTIAACKNGQFILSTDVPENSKITEADFWFVDGTKATRKVKNEDGELVDESIDMKLHLADAYFDRDSVRIVMTVDEDKEEYKIYTILANFTYAGSNDTIRAVPTNSN